MSEPTIQEVLKSLIDRHGLYAVTSTIAETCQAKAEHIEVNWQDRAAAKR